MLRGMSGPMRDGIHAVERDALRIEARVAGRDTAQRIGWNRAVARQRCLLRGEARINGISLNARAGSWRTRRPRGGMTVKLRNTCCRVVFLV